MGCSEACHVTEGAELGRDPLVLVNAMKRYDKTCVDVLQAAQKKGYAGYSKFDALNSPLLRALSMNNKWLRLLLTQLVNHSPFHIRPFLRVTISRNPKGISLFVRAHLLMYEMTGHAYHKEEAEKLLEWLVENKAHGSQHASWGYNFVWQNTLFVQWENEPNCVVTLFAGEAFIHAYRLLKKEKYLVVARDIADFILKELPLLVKKDGELAIGYVPAGNHAVVININALAGAFLAKVWRHTEEAEVIEFAQGLLKFTVNRRTAHNAWYYTHPSKSSPLRHDNYHTGGILDALLEYFEETGDERYGVVYWKGIDFYQKHLFEPDGAPRWMNDRKYPFDIHGSAQGIISFSKASRHRAPLLDQAARVADWTLTNLYRKKTNDFAYREGALMIWNYSLMRWCNAWMARALSELGSVYERRD
jgi:hypothetical protein